MGKGVLITPTINGNILAGPTASDIEGKSETDTTQEGISEVISKSAKIIKNIPYDHIITSFAGLRACESSDDFVINEVPDVECFINCAGISSPGLTASPAIGKKIALMMADRFGFVINKKFNGNRKGITNPKKLSLEERNELIKNNSAYGRIVCRCEEVSEGEIIEATKRNPPAKSFDGIKRRTRAGMGRCQSGFCALKVMKILVNECDEIDEFSVSKKGEGSEFIMGLNKENL